MSLKKSLKEYYDEFKDDPEFIAEELVFDITERISRIMENNDISRTELANRLRTTKAYITKLLDGNTNMTLLTIAKLQAALGNNIINVPLVEEKELDSETIFAVSRTWIAATIAVVVISAAIFCSKNVISVPVQLNRFSSIFI